MKELKPLRNREDARRLAKTLLEHRGVSVLGGTRRMQALPANVVASYHLTPFHQRTVKMEEIKLNVVVLRYAAGR